MSGIRNEQFYLQRSFQAWWRNNLDWDQFSIDVDLAAWCSRKDQETEPPAPDTKLPEIVCLFEAKCADNRADPVTPRDLVGKDGRNVDMLQSLAKAAGVPLFLVAYKHFADKRPSQDWETQLVREGYETIPGAADIEWFAVSCLYPRMTEPTWIEADTYGPLRKGEVRWLTPEQFKKWEAWMRRRLFAFYNDDDAQDKHRRRVYDERDANMWPELYKVLGLEYQQKPWVSPEVYAGLPSDQQAGYVCSDGDMPSFTVSGIPQADRPEGSRHQRDQPDNYETATIQNPTLPPLTVETAASFQESNIETATLKQFGVEQDGGQTTLTVIADPTNPNPP